MINKMALLWWSIPVFNWHVLTSWQISSTRSISAELNTSWLTHSLGFLCAGTGDLVSAIHPIDYKHPLTIWQTSSYATSTQTTDKCPWHTWMSISWMHEDVCAAGRPWIAYANQPSEWAAATGRPSPEPPTASTTVITASGETYRDPRTQCQYPGPWTWRNSTRS